MIIGVILLASVGLGFVNEYKAAKTAEALHSSIRHRCVVLRDGQPQTVDVTELVPGDVADLQLVVAVGTVLPFTPLAHILGFRPLPSLFFLALAGIVVCYLALIELGNYWFFRLYHGPVKPASRQRTPGHRVRRRAAVFSTRVLSPVTRRRKAGLRARPRQPQSSTAPAR